MPKLKGSTPDLKGQKIEKMGNWEESLPLPDFEVTRKKIEEKPKPWKQAQISGQPAEKKRLNFNKRFVLILAVGVFVLIIGGFSLIYFNQKGQGQKPQKLTSQAGKTIFRRISSAFVPKSPSTEPAQLWVNWKKFEDPEGLSFYYPEEWTMVKDESGLLYTIYYPGTLDPSLNLAEDFLAKLSIDKETPTANLAEFLLKRYNLSSANFREENRGQHLVLEFEFNKTFVFAQSFGENFYILEGKVKNLSDFENFLPIFENFAKSFQVAQ